MKKNSIYTSLLLFASLALNNQAYSQKNDSLLKDNKIEVIKDFMPVLSEAIKIPVNPNPEKPTFERPAFTYAVSDQQYLVKPTIYTIKPLSLGTMLLPKLKGNYTKVGYGNYNMPLLEIGFNTVRNKKYQAGVFIHHLSANGNDNYSNFSNSDANAYVKNFFAKGVFSIDAGFQRNGVNLYGSPNDVIKPSAEPSIVYHAYDANLGYQSLSKDSNNLTYKINFGFYHFNNSNSYNENDAALKVILAKHNSNIPFELATGLRINNNALFKANLPSSNYQRVYFDLNPQIFLTGTNYYIKGGFNSTISSDSAGAKFHFFPKAEAAYTIVPKKLSIYAGLTGNLNANTFKNIAALNPFATDISLKNTITKVAVYGGLKGELGAKTSFFLSTSSASVQNLVCFTKDSSKANQLLVYDEGNSKITTLAAGIQYQYNEKFRLGLSTTVIGYELKNLARAYSLPQFETKLNSTYNIADKFLLKLDLLYWGERFGRLDASRGDGTFASTDVKMNPFLDLNFGIDYRYSKTVSAFINFNNLANNRYQRFYGYTVYGTNFIGGFTFTF